MVRVINITCRRECNVMYVQYVYKNDGMIMMIGVRPSSVRSSNKIRVMDVFNFKENMNYFSCKPIMNKI